MPGQKDKPDLHVTATVNWRRWLNPSLNLNLNVNVSVNTAGNLQCRNAFSTAS